VPGYVRIFEVALDDLDLSEPPGPDAIRHRFRRLRQSLGDRAPSTEA
jgi:hypothetical protein